MASSTIACQRITTATAERYCIGHEPRSPDYPEAFHSSLLQRGRLGFLGQQSQTLASKWLKKRRRVNVMRASSTKVQNSSVAALSLPFGKQGPAAVSAEPQTQTHIVQRGQVMSKIAQLYNTDLKTLHELNPGVALDYVRPKQTIIVPIVKEAASGSSGSAPMCPPKGSAPPSKPQSSWFTPPSPQSTAPPAKPKAETLATAKTAAPIPEQQTVESSRGPLNYTVQPGDSLFTIAEKFGVSMTELVQLNKLHFKSTIRPTQVLKVPANSRPQAALVASVCPAPAPTCPPSYHKPQTNWTVGVGVALLLAAGAVYAAKLFQGKKSAIEVGETQPPPVATTLAVAGAPIVADEAKGLEGAEVISALATPTSAKSASSVTKPEVAANPVTQPDAAPSSLSDKLGEEVVAVVTQQDTSPATLGTADDPEANSQGAVATSPSLPTPQAVSEQVSTPNPPPESAAPTEAVTASGLPAQTPTQSDITPAVTPAQEVPLPEVDIAPVVEIPPEALGEVSEGRKDAGGLVAGLEASQAAAVDEPAEKATAAMALPIDETGSLFVEPTDLPSLEAAAQQSEQGQREVEVPAVEVEVPAVEVTVPAVEVEVPAVKVEPVVEAGVETSALAVIEGEGGQNGAASMGTLESAAGASDGASQGGALPVDIMPDEVLPLERIDVAGKQLETSNGNLGVGSSFCQETTITRALQNAYRAASQSLGPLHQTLAFVALSSGRIGLASQEYTWGSTAEAVVALRTTLPADCNLQGICTWGVNEQANGGGGEEKEWAAVLLFSARDRVLSSGSTITTGSARLAAEMAAEGLAAKAVGKKLKAVIIVSSPQADRAAIDVVRETIPGLPVYAISESKVPDESNRPVSFAKEWQVAPTGPISAVAPGISLVGVTTDADFGGAFLATVVGQWLYGPKCTIEALPPVFSKEMATSGR